ncbi:hypothetical protein RhiTH_007887 [Rhizoctonia solani]
MAQQDVYTVIEFDSPNFFSTCFQSGFQEAHTGRLSINRDPAVFEYIVSYLSGYEILRPVSRGPLQLAAALDKTLLYNIRTDAAFFQLDGLVHRVDSILIPYVDTMKLNERCLAFLGIYLPTNIRTTLEVPGKAFTGVTEWKTTPITAKVRARAPFNQLEIPYSGSNFDDFHTLAMVQQVLREKLGEQYLKHWRLVGYQSEYEEDAFRYLNIILVERIGLPLVSK